MGTVEDRFAAEATPLLQALIRNACVNDGTPDSGHEARNVDTLVAALEGPGIDIERYEAAPGRDNLVARIEGTDPDAPTLLLHAHTDVVPAHAERWAHDPFGGELVDGQVWGRGAIDMLNHAATIAVALRHLADQGWTPKGTLVFAATADKEHRGALGARWLVEHHPDQVRAEWVITETGGVLSPSPVGMRLPVVVGEKGSVRLRVHVSGAPCRPATPSASTALVHAAEAVTRLARFDAPYRDGFPAFVERSGWGAVLGDLLDPDTLTGVLASLPSFAADGLRALTHTTLCPVRLDAGGPSLEPRDRVSVAVDVRTFEGQGPDEGEALVRQALGDLAEMVTIEHDWATPASSSPFDTPLWATLDRLSQRWLPGIGLVPLIAPGRTDAPAFRELGAIAYGFGRFSERVTPEALAGMIHGDDERVDIESLGLMAGLWVELAREALA